MHLAAPIEGEVAMYLAVKRKTYLMMFLFVKTKVDLTTLSGLRNFMTLLF
jgi:hypothetical protein